LGPLIIALVVQARGLASTWIVAVPGLVACGLLWRFIPGRRPMPAATASRGLRADLRAAFAPLFVLWLIVVLRSVIISAYQTFLPLLLQQRGGSIVEGGWAVFVFGGIGALGGISGGTLSDRYGRRRMLGLSLILGVPMLYGFIRTSGPLAYVFLAAGGVSIYLSAAVTIVMAQELLPHRASVASSIVMGLAWGTAGLSLTGVGAVADVIGLEGALTWTLTLAIVALAAVARLPARTAPERAPALTA
ncbi:MAG TPA: MFS transporter, partial [bacterium]|nr:MFS transporter [bacterium]